MDSRIRHSIAYMRENLEAKLTEKALAQQAGLTPQHFCVLFKTETSETPTRYLNRLRMDQACELLASDGHSSLSIKEIATRVGCNDLSHFVRDFEKRFGLSPKRYRATRDSDPAKP
jgi:AraC family transcriptional regulator of arabinose operon